MAFLRFFYKLMQTILAFFSSFFQNKKILIGLFLFGLVFKVFAIRFYPYPGDFIGFIVPWVDFIKANGYLDAFRYPFANYAPAYLYFLLGIAKFNLDTLYGVKLISIFFDYLIAWFVGSMAYEKYKESWVRWCALAVIPLLPTVLVNSSYWGQCDSVYTAFLMGSLYFVLKRKSLLSVLFWGISFSFKLQAIMLAPFFFVLLLRNRIKWYYFLLVPAVYVLSVMPAYIAGRPLSDLLTIYVAQSEQYKELSLNFTNLYMWISDNYYHVVKWIGMGVTALFTLVMGGLLAWKYPSKLTNDYLIRLAFLSAAICPFLLPGMHERYMFAGDVLAGAYILYFPRKFYNAIGIPIVSLFSCSLCTSLREIFLPYPAFLMTLLYVFFLYLLIRDFVQSVQAEKN